MIPPAAFQTDARRICSDNLQHHERIVYRELWQLHDAGRRDQAHDERVEQCRRQGDRVDLAKRDRMSEPVDHVTAGRAAWARLRDHEKATWADRLDVARALAIGRTAALKPAATNKCVGSRYNTAMAAWLKEHGLADVVAQERYRLLLILQNIG
jgi:hypothetical protein